MLSRRATRSRKSRNARSLASCGRGALATFLFIAIATTSEHACAPFSAGALDDGGGGGGNPSGSLDVNAADAPLSPIAADGETTTDSAATADVISSGADATALIDGATPGCTTLVFDDFSNEQLTLNTWRLDQAKVTNGEIELVPALTGRKGGIWLEKPVDANVGSVRVQFTSKITPNNDEADGLAVVLTTTATPALGGTGHDFGICNSNTKGIALVLDDLFNQVGLADLDQNCPRGGNFTIAGAMAATVVGVQPVTVVATKLGGTWASVGTKILTFGKSKPTTTIQAIGFTASTGGSATRHAIDNVLIEHCP